MLDMRREPKNLGVTQAGVLPIRSRMSSMTRNAGDAISRYLCYFHAGQPENAPYFIYWMISTLS